MNKENEVPKKAMQPEEIADVIRAIASEGDFVKMRANLWRIAQTRGLVGASLNLHFGEDAADYYNVYRYAFFGLVPDLEEEIISPVKLNLNPEKYELHG